MAESPVRGRTLPSSLTKPLATASASALLFSASSASVSSSSRGAATNNGSSDRNDWQAYAAAAAVACNTPPPPASGRSSARPGSAASATAAAGFHSSPPSSASREGNLFGDGELTEDHLREVTGFQNLSLVSEAELTIDAAHQSTYLISTFLPNVMQLRLSRSSNVPSIRDLGTGFTSLQVLWMSACNVQLLSGLQSGFGEHLKELYLAFNHVKDVSPLLGLEQLEVLDLEGNLLQDGDAVLDALLARKAANLPALKSLTLTGNAFLGRMGLHTYHKAVAKAVGRFEKLYAAEQQALFENDNGGGGSAAVRAVPLETLDDVPVKAIVSKVAAASHEVDSRGNSSDDEEQQQPNDSNRGFEFPCEKQQRCKSEAGKSMGNGAELDELSVLQSAIRTQLGRTGEQLLAEESVRTTSRLMSRQRSIAPEEQRQRFRVATASSEGAGAKQRREKNGAAAAAAAAGEEDGHDDDQRRKSPDVSQVPVRPPPPTTINVTAASLASSSKKKGTCIPQGLAPLPPSVPKQSRSRSSSVATSVDSNGNNNIRNNDGDSGAQAEKEEEEEEAEEEAPSIAAVGNLMHRRRQKMKQQQEEASSASSSPARGGAAVDELGGGTTAKQPFAVVLANRIANNNNKNSQTGKKAPNTSSNFQEDRFAAALRKQKMQQFDEECDRILAEIDKAEEDPEGLGPLFRSEFSNNNNEFVDPSSSRAGNDNDNDDDESFLCPMSASKSHGERMSLARKLLRLADKKRKREEEEAEERRQRRASKMKKQKLNDDDCTSSDVSSFSDDDDGDDGDDDDDYSDSQEGQQQAENDDDEEHFEAQSRTRHPLTEEELLRRLLADKETVLAQLKKDIESHDRFGVKDGKFDSLDWQGGEGECSVDAL